MTNQERQKIFIDEVFYLNIVPCWYGMNGRMTIYIEAFEGDKAPSLELGQAVDFEIHYKGEPGIVSYTGHGFFAGMRAKGKYNGRRVLEWAFNTDSLERRGKCLK